MKDKKRFNLSNREESENVPIGVFCEDKDGKKTAGLTGETFGNWLCIQYLYVDNEYRGQGIGRNLLLAAEKEAAERGCKYVFVDTFSFQAPEFYKKMGYETVFVLDQYPYTGKRYYFSKVLSQ